MKLPHSLYLASGLIIAQLFSFSVAAKSTSPSSKLKPLLFQADKNNLQVLPQRFEYTLVDEDRIKVGDILIDSTQVTFKVEPSKNGLYKIHFTWPAGLLKEGELALKNNSGKAIYSTLIKKDNIKITPKTEEDGLRSDMAEFTAEDIEKNLIDDIKFIPFMSFCIFRESRETRIYLCSKELYVSSQDGKMTIKARSATKKTAYVDINGKVVGNQGIIYLNDKSENIVFKTQTQSGATLEIETRKKDVDFKDITTDSEEKNIILIASGAEPVDESKVSKISSTDWKIELPAARPILYLKGEGDIPMRQEFYVRGPLPKESDRPFLSIKSADRTYSSNLRFQGISPQGVQVSAADKTTKVELRPKNQFIWNLYDIPTGMVRRYLNVEGGNNKYVAAYDISRGSPFEVFLGGKYLSPSGIAYGDLSLQWWFENFLWINSDFTRFHWGVSISQSQHLTKKDTEQEVDFTTAELLWRAQEGFYLKDSTWGIAIPLQVIKTPTTSTMAPGLGVFWQTESPRYLNLISDWTQLKLNYLSSSSGGDIKLKSAFELKALLYSPITSSLFVRYGLGSSQYDFEGATGKNQIFGDLGVSWLF